jgi:hypothetical protein
MADDTQRDRERRDERERDDESTFARDESDTDRESAPNPPRTTTGKWTSPKFGSAGSGGAELEPGPERD